MPSEYHPLLERSQLFAGLSEENRERACQLVIERRFSPNQTLFRQGDVGEELYIVAEGRIKVYLEDGLNETVLSHASSGDLLGEMALLTGAPRSASARTVTDGLLLVISHEEFQTYLQSNAGAMLEIARVIALRQAQANTSLGAARAGSLIRQVEHLTIKIDETELHQHVDQIVETEYFRRLQRTAKQMRERHQS